MHTVLSDIRVKLRMAVVIYMTSDEVGRKKARSCERDILYKIHASNCVKDANKVSSDATMLSRHSRARERALSAAATSNSVLDFRAALPSPTELQIFQTFI